MVDRRYSVPNVVAENIQVRYTVGTNDPRFRSRGVQRLGDLFLGRQGRTTVRALRGVNLVVNEGEMVGIVGANGSGKSTFLRTVAGVEQPDRGRILARYQPVLLGVHASLQQSLSGSENVRLGCLAMGLTPEEAAEAHEFVVGLSALGSAIYRPMETYSSGMSSRLRFAIALAARPKILLIDEALSTGDATFSERSSTAMSEMLSDAGTVFLVNHAAKVIQEMCSRAVWMHRGELIMDGPAEAVAERYRWWAWNVAKNESEVADKLLADVLRGASNDTISVLEPELHRNPIPRHASRRKPGKRLQSTSKRATRGRTSDRVEDDLEPSAAEEAALKQWSDALEPKESHVQFPSLPKPAREVESFKRRNDDPPPIRFSPRSKRIMLRPADPRDSATAAADLTNRRLKSQKQLHGSREDQSEEQARK
ncbi:ABC transporter ATP-binding protein [Brevibacterium aurantiacum]|uniref:ABC transporter ATP-binding protein n=1 Tax=Brevibacterium aurantiacum TaxID=273384 RepID=UPI000F649FE9|nr:ABC transporter ATP-binding protein [Brevibacterium aurantiacum]AZL11796.1 ABC transporter ATP-binding protein [Brevibacterium aurantiacum]